MRLFFYTKRKQRFLVTQWPLAKWSHWPEKLDASMARSACRALSSLFSWQQRLITGRQRNTWPWWWGIAQCLGGPRKRRCVKRSTLPGWPVWYLHQTSPAVLPAPGFRQLLTDGGPSVLPARRSWHWTRSLSCSAAKSAAPWCCPSSPPPGKPFAARSKLTHPPGSWLQLAGGWGTSNPAWTLKLIMIVFSLLSVSGLVAMPQLHWIITS